MAMQWLTAGVAGAAGYTIGLQQGRIAAARKLNDEAHEFIELASRLNDVAESMSDDAQRAVLQDVADRLLTKSENMSDMARQVATEKVAS